jgi:mercuric ion transport protein
MIKQGSRMEQNAELLTDNEGDLGTRAAAAGGILGALAMTSCCILPLVLFSLGATGAWIGRLGAMYQYKWFFFAFAGASLAYGFWKVYRAAGQACKDGTVCAVPLNQRLMKTALWSSATLILAALIFPYVSPFLIGY